MPGPLQASPIRAKENTLQGNNKPFGRLLGGSVDRPPPDDPDDEERPSNAEDEARRLAQAALKLYGLRDAESLLAISITWPQQGARNKAQPPEELVKGVVDVARSRRSGA